MREIKFRGKDCWGNWRYGDLMKNSIPTASPVIVENFYYDDPDDSMFEVDSETVGQYTGLTDSEGCKIYEGDILGAIKTKVLVEWGVDGWVADCFTLLEWLKLHDSRVIGNVYENPELLKEGGE